MPEKLENLYKVKLRASSSFAEVVTFDVTPGFSENKSVNYEALNPIHTPGSIYIYIGSPSRSFRIDAKLISRTPEEASKRLTQLHLLRGWTMPRFGIRSSTLDKKQSSAREYKAKTGGDPGYYDSKLSKEELQTVYQQLYGKEILGAPPEVLFLTAYANENGSSSTLYNLRKVPVVITSLSITYPDDVTYLPTEEGQPFPVIMSVGIDLAETHSPEEYARFSLDFYKKGILPNF